MKDEEFIETENTVKDAISIFKRACDEFGVDPGERLADILIDFDITIPSGDQS